MCLSAFARADEWLPTLAVNGQTYTNVTVTQVSDTDIYFTSNAGMANAKLKDLDRDLQKQFHYSASKARTAERQEARATEQYHLNVLRDSPQSMFSLPPGSGNAPPAESDGKPIWGRSYLNHLGPELFVERWLTAKPDCQGKFILYDFWSPTNAACLAEIPELNEFQKEFSDRLVVIGISDEPEAAVRRVVDQMVEYPVAIDTLARTETEVGVTGLPHLMLMDPNGYVRWEGYPFLPGHPFSNKVLTDVIAQYDRENP